uniref:DNA topoisomerase n=1 Tax=Ditylenchus dipsaci TaxID=166011 RepID=A0A915ET70_9BILA
MMQPSTYHTSCPENHCALREGRSKFNKLYCFEGDVLGAKSNIVFTSVSGHLTALEFDKAYKNWDQRNISALFSAPVIRSIPDNMSGIELTLRAESKVQQY